MHVLALLLITPVLLSSAPSSQGATDVAKDRQILVPALPAGTSVELNKAFNLIGESLSNRQFSEARKRLALLPSQTVTYSWDDSKVPAPQREELVAIRDSVFKAWSTKLPGTSFKRDSNPDLKFTFEKALAANSDSGLPRGVALFFSESSLEPRLEAVIGLSRGVPLQPCTDPSFYNEMSFAVGSYLGLAPSPLLGIAMGRSDLPMQNRYNIDVTEVAALNFIRKAIKSLSVAVANQTRMVPARTSVHSDPRALEVGPVVQGVLAEVKFQITNIGNAPLIYRVMPDCGCITAMSSTEIPANSSSLVSIKVDTTEIIGEFSKHLIVISNDTEEPYRFIPIKVKTIPRYRVLSRLDGPLIVDEGGMDVDIYFVSPKEKPLNIVGIEVVGNPGSATYESWSGSLPDPILNEAAKPRVGYRIKLHVDEPQVSGRSSATLVIRTDDAKYAVIRHTVFAQRGIAILPASIYFGEVGKVKRTGSVILTRPNRAFKIERIETDSASISARVEMLKGDYEYKLIVEYSGQAPIGDLRSTVTIITNDAKQPKLRVPVMAIVK